MNYIMNKLGNKSIVNDGQLLYGALSGGRAARYIIHVKERVVAENSGNGYVDTDL